MKRIVTTLIVLMMVLTLSVPTHAAEPVVQYEYGVIVGIIESRHGNDCMETVVVEVADGNIYDTKTVVDDYCIGDIVLIRRFKANPDDPMDDGVQVLRYVGWEQWYPTHAWNVMDEWIVPIF